VEHALTVARRGSAATKARSISRQVTRERKDSEQGVLQFSREQIPVLKQQSICLHRVLAESAL